MTFVEMALFSEIPRKGRSRRGRCANLSQIPREMCTKLPAFRCVLQEGCAKLPQICREFESQFRTILCKYPFSNAPFSKFLMFAVRCREASNLSLKACWAGSGHIAIGFPQDTPPPKLAPPPHVLKTIQPFEKEKMMLGTWTCNESGQGQIDMGLWFKICPNKLTTCSGRFGTRTFDPEFGMVSLANQSFKKLDVIWNL